MQISGTSRTVKIEQEISNKHLRLVVVVTDVVVDVVTVVTVDVLVLVPPVREDDENQ